MRAVAWASASASAPRLRACLACLRACLRRNSASAMACARRNSASALACLRRRSASALACLRARRPRSASASTLVPTALLTDSAAVRAFSDTAEPADRADSATVCTAP